MSTLEKTIDLLHTLPENQVEVIYSFVQFLSSQQETKKMLSRNPWMIFLRIS